MNKTIYYDEKKSWQLMDVIKFNNYYKLPESYP